MRSRKCTRGSCSCEALKEVRVAVEHPVLIRFGVLLPMLRRLHKHRRISIAQALVST